MKSYCRNKTGYAFNLALKITGSVLVVYFLFVFHPLAVHAEMLTGESHTILRMRETTDDRKLYPLYEYLNLSGDTAHGQGLLTYTVGGWGRFDLRDKRTEDDFDHALSHGYVGYKGDKSNLSFLAGRQFIAEGVAAERLDGLYARSDLAAGVTASAFVGSPVTTETDFRGGDMIYGGRIAHSISTYYTVGLSALRSEEDGDSLREEQGIDIWVRPSEKLDITGRSSYNSITSGWMEHAYNFTYAPLDAFRIYGGLSRVSYRDYFHHVTTKALSLTTGPLDPREKVLTLSGIIEYTVSDYLTVSADYKNYDYEIAGKADYYGAKATSPLSESLMAGFSIHRMDGESDRLQFSEYRLFVSKKIGKIGLTADFFDVHYDRAINSVNNTYSMAVAASYGLTEQLKVAADIEYGKTVDFDERVTGLVKLTYYFGM